MSESGNARRLRCAIYTRKSTEEGLDQDFNSLDAQREACAAYIASQASLGWRLVADQYDDGGISGGTMERPALQRLLSDIRERRVDVVVVYKIDRLTRSLADFAKIVEIFDQAEASFVFITQQFNTTTSMGRLTLNVLLSFDQFEREVTAERIRDKIAASKKKGMWMGGTVPLGYRHENRKLIVDEQEAEIVHFIFDRYLALGSIRGVVAVANARKFRPRLEKAMGYPEQLVEDDDRPADGASACSFRKFSRGQISWILSNPLYIGKVRHRDNVYDGSHQAIIDVATFERVRGCLRNGAPPRRSLTNTSGAHLLQGRVFDRNGEVLRSTHAKTRGVRYRYYVSKDALERPGGDGDIWRLPAIQLERIVERELRRFLDDGARLGDAIAGHVTADQLVQAHGKGRALGLAYEKASPQLRSAMIASLVDRVDLRTGKLLMTINLNGLLRELGFDAGSEQSDSQPASPVIIECPMTLRRRGIETRLVIADDRAADRKPDPNLVSVIAVAHGYLAQLTDGSNRSSSEVAAADGVDRSDFARILRLAFLSPRLVDSIFAGRQPVELTARHLSRLSDLPLSWHEQEQLLGLDLR